MTGLLGAVAVVLVAVGIFGFTRPPSDEAKRQGDRLEQQVNRTRDTVKALETSNAGIRDAVAKLDALDVQEASAARSLNAAFNSAVDSYNATGDASAFSDPGLRQRIDALGTVEDQVEAQLSTLDKLVAQAQEAQR